MNDKIRLKDACKILNGFAFKSGKYVDSGIRIIRIANVQKGYVEDERPVFCPNSEESSIRDYMLEEDDLLLSLTGNVGRVALLDKRWLPAALNQRVACLRIKDDRIIKDYLYFALLSDKFENDCIESSKGIAQKNMSTEWLKDYEIPLPSGQKQREIVSSLKQLSMIIKNKTEQIQQLDDLIKARFVEMFGDIDRYISIKDSGLFIADGNYSSKYPRSSEFTSFGVPFIRANNIKDNTVVDDDMYFISPEKHDELKKGHLLHGDILVTTRGNIGQLGIVPQKHNDSNINAQIVLLRCRDTKYLPEYLLFALQTVDVKKQFIRQQTGTALKQLPVKHLEKISFIDAPVELQNQFANLAIQVDKSKFVLSNKLTMCDFYIRLIHDRVMHGRINLRMAQ